MSEVDTRFAAEERSLLLEEVRGHLPAFLSPAAAEHHDPVGDVRTLLNLESKDFERVRAVHVLLSAPIRRFVSALRNGLRRPITASTRPKETTQALRGPIDWGATWAARATAAGNPALYVVRPSRRIFDTPENQTLIWILGQIQRELAKVPRPRDGLANADVEERGWFLELEGMRNELLLASRTRWLRGVASVRPDAAALRRLAVARTVFYREVLGDAVRTISRFTEDPSDEDLTELLCERHFRPSRDWQLFEVVVALRLAAEMARGSGKPRRRRLLAGGGGGRVPYARYVLGDGDEVTLWYQHWPRGDEVSVVRDTQTRHQLRGGGTRPDLVIQRSGKVPDYVVLELKASRAAGYLSAGLSQLLGYLHDRSALVSSAPAGWLVAPPHGPFTAAPPEEHELWMVDADAVADAARRRFVV